MKFGKYQEAQLRDTCHTSYCFSKKNKLNKV